MYETKRAQPTALRPHSTFDKILYGREYVL